MGKEDEGKDPADDIVARYIAGSLPHELTVLSTCAFSVTVIGTNPSGEPISIMFDTTDTNVFRRQITACRDNGYRFSVENAKVNSSFHQDLLHRARSDLCGKIMGKNPSPSLIMQTILNIGTALNYQIDQDLNAPDAGIDTKLEGVGLRSSNEPLHKKYKDLNPFYNATKHAKLEDNKRNRVRLEGPDGMLIAADYFETVRQIFVWYYQQKGAPAAWPELEPIKWSDFGVNYSFDLSKRWHPAT